MKELDSVIQNICTVAQTLITITQQNTNTSHYKTEGLKLYITGKTVHLAQGQMK